MTRTDTRTDTRTVVPAPSSRAGRALRATAVALATVLVASACMDRPFDGTVFPGPEVTFSGGALQPGALVRLEVEVPGEGWLEFARTHASNVVLVPADGLGQNPTFYRWEVRDANPWELLPPRVYAAHVRAMHEGWTDEAMPTFSSDDEISCLKKSDDPYYIAYRDCTGGLAQSIVIYTQRRYSDGGDDPKEPVDETCAACIERVQKNGGTCVYDDDLMMCREIGV